jgi:glycosyltransferase involved in cell wall biosynthesis
MAMLSGPDVSVIISTYNAPRWLELVLEGYFCQAFTGSFELVIADDGSTEETARLIERMSSRSPVSIHHIWQPDEGFQKCRILNKAIAVSCGRLLLFTDGDCIPQPTMVAIHHGQARSGWFLTGGYLKLPKAISEAISVSDIKAGQIFRPGWLIRHGFRPSGKLLKLMLPRPWDRLANQITPTKRTWNGHNSSCHRDDAIAVNGFNEQMQYGGEDVEFGSRLNHFGVRGRHVRFSTIPLHLHHGHSYVKAGMRERNAQIRQQTLHSRLQRSPLGLHQWLREDGSLRLAKDDHHWHRN